MINKDYEYSTVYKNIDQFVLEIGSSYIYGYSPEGRSRLVDKLKTSNQELVNFIEISLSVSKEDVIISNGTEFLLRSSESIKTFLGACSSSIIYIDITGLSNRVSAALLKTISEINIDHGLDIRIIYAEPKTYKVKNFKLAGIFNDLSEKIEGIFPLPGFASIMPDNIDIKFIALLGFEGGRFTHMLEHVEPPVDNIVPVIGVPGFRAEYPFIALWGNRQPLENTKSWVNVEYAAANSIVDSFFLLEKIHNKDKKTMLKIAPIGTKPHAIGAILFALKHPRNVEIVYDNPIRVIERTEGIGLVIETYVNKLLNSDRS